MLLIFGILISAVFGRLELTEHFLETAQFIRTRAQADHAAGNHADSLSSRMQRIYDANLALEGLYLSCPAALALPPLMAQIRAAGLAAQVTQQVLLGLIKAEVSAMNLEGHALYRAPRRQPTGPCNLPGLLVWPQESVKFLAPLAGFRIHNSLLGKAHWYFEHPQARALP